MAIRAGVRDLGLLSQQVLVAFDNPPANAVFIDSSDTMQINIASSITPQNLTFNCRVLSSDGSISFSQQILTCTGSRIITRQLLPPGEGLLLSVSISVPQNSGVRRGMVYISINLIRGTTTLTTVVTQPLCSGYVTDHEVVTYPPGLFEASFSGRGNIRSITGSAPSVGAEISETVPFGAMWALHMITFTLVSSATVITRAVSQAVDDGANLLTQSASIISQTAGQTIRYNYAAGYAGSVVSGSPSATQLASATILPPGFRIRTITTNLQVGDQYSAPQYLVEEWLQV